MPFIRITVFGSTLTAEQIRQLQQSTTDMMTSIMRKPIEGTAVLVELINQGGWSIAGSAVPIAAHVEATIGQDTNMPDEKSHRRNDAVAPRLEPPRWLPPLF